MIGKSSWLVVIFLIALNAKADVLSKAGSRKSALVKKCKVDGEQIKVTACDETECTPTYTPLNQFSCIGGNACKATGGDTGHAFVVNGVEDGLQLKNAIASNQQPKILFWSHEYDADVPKNYEATAFAGEPGVVKGVSTVGKGYKAYSIKDEKEAQSVSFLEESAAFSSVLMKMPGCPFRN